MSFMEQVVFHMGLDGYGQENMGEGYSRQKQTNQPTNKKIVSKDPKAEKHLV